MKACGMFLSLFVTSVVFAQSLDAVTAADRSTEITVVGTASGEIIEGIGETSVRERLCDSKVASVSRDAATRALYAICGGELFTRPSDTGTWRKASNKWEGTLRSVVVDPFHPNAFSLRRARRHTA